VTRFEHPKEGVVIIIFNDEKTDVAKIVEALAKGHFTVKGKPVYLEPASPEEKRVY